MGRDLVQYGLTLDQRTCIGWHACMGTCQTEHAVRGGQFRTTVRYVDAGTFPETAGSLGLMRCISRKAGTAMHEQRRPGSFIASTNPLTRALAMSQCFRIDRDLIRCPISVTQKHGGCDEIGIIWGSVVSPNRGEFVFSAAPWAAVVVFSQVTTAAELSRWWL